MTVAKTTSSLQSGLQSEHNQRTHNWEELKQLHAFKHFITVLKYAADPSSDQPLHLAVPLPLSVNTESGVIGAVRVQLGPESGVESEYDQWTEYFPTTCMLEITTSDAFNPCCKATQKLVNTLEGENDKINVILVNIFDVLKGNPQQAGIGDNLVADVDLIRELFEHFFKTIAYNCYEQSASFILTFDTTADIGSEDMGIWNVNLRSDNSKVSYLRHVFRMMAEMTERETSSNLKHVNFIACSTSVTAVLRNGDVNQGVSEVIVLCFTLDAAADETRFYNQLYSVQREQTPVISSSFPMHPYVPTVFAPIHQSYDSMEPSEEEEEGGGGEDDDEETKIDQTHPPNLSEVTTLITKSG